VARHSLVPSPVVGSVDAEGGLAASGVALSPAAAFDVPVVLGGGGAAPADDLRLVPFGGPWFGREGRWRPAVRVAGHFICVRRMG
jgi:hypothetical protein